MDTLPIEMLQEIGLYLDPESHHNFRISYRNQLPFQQRALPCFFDYPIVIRLFERLTEITMDDVDVIRLTEFDKEIYQKLLQNGCLDLLVPFATEALEIDPHFYHSDKLKIAIVNYQSIYTKALFKQPKNVVGLTEL